MKKSSKANNAWLMFTMLFFLSIITVLFIAGFRFLKVVMNDYEESIRQVAINKTNLFLNDLQGITDGVAKKVLRQKGEGGGSLKELLSFDHRITGIYILDDNGRIINQAPEGYTGNYMFPKEAWKKRPHAGTQILGVHSDNNAQAVITMVTPLKNERLAIDYTIAGFQQELSYEFLSSTFQVAIFDNHNYPIVWPFDHNLLDQFTGREKVFSVNRIQYNIKTLQLDRLPWRLYFFQKENNFDTYRVITVMFLLFALYCCLYQFLVELWRMNSARTYFENIDFTIFNHVNEGVIVSNNAGRVLFANRAAHEIFDPKGGSLKGVKLKEFLGHIGDDHGQNKYGTMTLKTADRLLQAIHSPIIRKSKVLGALTVIRTNSKEEEIHGHALSQLINALSQGVVYIDKNHRVVQANLVANFLLGNLSPGMSIDAVDPELAGFIYQNIGSRSIKRVKLSSLNITAEVSFIYDNDGVYAGTVVMLSGPAEFFNQVYSLDTPAE